LESIGEIILILM